jgi:peptide/nickel transport system permease protein
MLRFLARRLLFALFLVAAVASAALFLTRLAPGDVTAQLGPFATPQEIARTRAQYGLDRPMVTQWALWAGRALRFDFGDSYLYNRPVRGLIGRAAANTAALAVVALALATFIGIPLGVFTGSRHGPAATLVRALSLVCISIPPLLTSLLLVFIASRTRWFPTGGMTSVQAADLQWSAWIADVVSHLPLPALALALPIAATFERLQAQSMSDALHQPFLLAAIARGVSPRDLIVRHAWPVSVRPICAVYGIAIGALLSGSFVVEYVTSWPGLGRLMFEALRARDIYLVAGCAAIGSIFLAAGTFLSDAALAVADPRTTE